MAKAEKLLFSFLIALLILGLGIKFYKLRQEKLDLTLTHDVRQALPAPAEKRDKKNGGIVDLNSATVEELASLPDLGKTRAHRIVDYRNQHGPFQKKSDLLKVDSISISLYKKIESYIISR